MALTLSVFYALFIAAVTYYYPEIVRPEYKPKETKVVHSVYDFIVVGAGSAGSVVASRLSENRHWNVLLIEAGGDETPKMMTPILNQYLDTSGMTWNYTTVPQKNACLATKGICEYPRGYGMGGSSSINGMLYVRGNKFDFDNWKKMGLKEWGYEQVLPYFLKSEDMKQKDKVDSAYHRAGGPLSVQFAKYTPPLTDDVIKAGVELGMREGDYNGKIQSSIGRSQLTVNGAQRWSTSSAFLTPNRNRINLSILKFAKVIKVIIDPVSKAAIGIKYIKDGVVRDVYSKKEVILSAGAVDTPKLLMLSGVGPKDHLESLEIPVVANLPVGDNLQDHAIIRFPFITKGKSGLPPAVYITPEAIIDFAVNKTGPLTSNGITALAFIDTASTNINSDPPDFEIHVVMMQANDTPKEDSILTMGLTVLRPDSVGQIRLKSKDHRDPPLIDTQYNSHPNDLKIFLAGMRIVLRMMRSKAMEKYKPEVYAPLIPDCEKFISDDEMLIKCMATYYSSTVYHPIGTARMGAQSDPAAVLGPNLKVKGIQRLRVIDASVMPKITSGNTNAPTIMIAEKGSDIIKKYYNVHFK